MKLVVLAAAESPFSKKEISHATVSLSIGIAIEILATSSLKLSDGFTKRGCAGLTLICFGLAFYVMSLVVRAMPVGIAYSVWAGDGIAGVTLIGAVAFGQTFDAHAYLEVGLIIVGIVVLHLLLSAASG